MTEKKSIAARLIDARMSVGRVAFNGYNQHQKFKFLAWQDVLHAANNALCGAGLDLQPEIIDAQITYVERTTRAVVKFKMHISSIDGDSIERLWVAEANDTSDKAISKAITFGVKTFLLKLLLITDREDARTADEHTDTDADSDSVPTPAPASAPAPQKHYKINKVLAAMAELEKRGETNKAAAEILKKYMQHTFKIDSSHNLNDQQKDQLLEWAKKYERANI